MPVPSEEFPFLCEQATQAGFARLVGVTQQAVGKMVEKGVLRPGDSWLDWIQAAFGRLRQQAAGHMSDGGADLTQQRVKTEIIERKLKELQLAEKLGLLVPAEDIEAKYTAMVTSARAELLSMGDKLRARLETEHGIQVDPGVINEYINISLGNLSGGATDS